MSRIFTLVCLILIPLSANPAVAGPACIVGNIGVPDGTLLLQMGVTDYRGAALYRQCVAGTLGPVFSTSDLPSFEESPTAAAPSGWPAPAGIASTSEAASAVGAGDVADALRALLKSEPGLIAGALQQAQAAQQREDDQARRAKLAEMMPSIVSSGIALGSPSPDVTVVEWVDYSCPYCQQSATEVTRLLVEDAKVRVVIAQRPILGPGSRLAAKAAIASTDQGRFADFHAALMALKLGHGREFTMEAIEGEALRLGLDVAKLRADMDSPVIEGKLAAMEGQADALGLRSTPTFAIDNSVIPSGLTFEGLRQRLAAARAGRQS
jgi:protein-disulfide isomerase